ncbi:cellular tumor antigen p53 [Neodiprion fabricii]|uniref:cellular tumor antigen p53 n=1 Tax=Neodiprion fabricii TaxID=2872261 RepID=UPI001ED9789E|nr:cellular tumor antigen p53 [Neodiprion fabricii]
MASESSLSLLTLTSSQEDSIISELRDNEINLQDLHDFAFDHTDIVEEKFDISHYQETLPNHNDLSTQTVMQAQMPANQEFAGELNFELLPNQQDGSKSWVYSAKLQKVFIEMEKTLPLWVKWSPPHGQLYVRAGMAFCEPTHRSDPVTRCHNHIALSDQNIPYLRHVLSCKHNGARYCETNTGHYSVLVPLGTPEPGTDSVQMDFTFHCKNSCSTGINRKPTEVIFTLETDRAEVLGRRKLLVRICSCPKRDRGKEEKELRESSGGKKRKIMLGKKYISLPVEQQHETDAEIFSFNVKIYGRDNYETVKKVTSSVMAQTLVDGGPSAVIQPLIEYIKRLP